MIKTREERAHHRPLVVAETVGVVNDGSPPVPTALQLVEFVLALERLIRLVTIGQLLQLNQRLGRFAAVARRAPLLEGFALALDVDLSDRKQEAQPAELFELQDCNGVSLCNIPNGLSGEDFVGSNRRETVKEVVAN